MSKDLVDVKRKITVTLSERLIKRLDEQVSPRGRSNFIATAIEDRLVLQEQVAILKETAGAWLDENHPDMHNGDAIDLWVEEFRASWSNIAD